MSKEVNIQELSEITASDIPGAINRSIKAGRPLMIHGSPGLGKSAGALQAADDQREKLGLETVVQLGEIAAPETEFGYFDIRLTNMGPEEFGLPSADNDRGIQTRLPVDWFPSTDRDDLPEHGLLVFEEIVSCAPAMQAAVYQITHDRRLGDKKLKEGWHIVLTGNLLTDGGVVHKMATPLANRLIHVYVRSDVDSWCNWALTNNIEPVVVGFVRFRPDLLNTFAAYVKKKQSGHAFATERSWEMVSDQIDGDNIDPLESSMIAGTVGAGPATEFSTFRKVWKDMPNIDGILLDPHNATIPEGRATMYAVCSALAHRATRDNFSTIMKYTERLSAEFHVLAIQDATRRNAELMSTAAFNKFAVEYHEFLR